MVVVSVQSQFDQEEVLYQGCVKLSCWDEQGKKCKERYVVLRRDYKVGIYDNMEVTLAQTHFRSHSFKI